MRPPSRKTTRDGFRGSRKSWFAEGFDLVDKENSTAALNTTGSLQGGNVLNSTGTLQSANALQHQCYRNPNTNATEIRVNYPSNPNSNYAGNPNGIVSKTGMPNPMNKNNLRGRRVLRPSQQSNAGPLGGLGLRPGTPVKSKVTSMELCSSESLSSLRRDSSSESLSDLTGPPGEPANTSASNWLNRSQKFKLESLENNGSKPRKKSSSTAGLITAPHCGGPQDGFIIDPKQDGFIVEPSGHQKDVIAGGSSSSASVMITSPLDISSPGESTKRPPMSNPKTNYLRHHNYIKTQPSQSHRRLDDAQCHRTLDDAFIIADREMGANPSIHVTTNSMTNNSMSMTNIPVTTRDVLFQDDNFDDRIEIQCPVREAVRPSDLRPSSRSGGRPASRSLVLPSIGPRKMVRC